MESPQIRFAEPADAPQIANLFCAGLRPDIVPLLIYGCRGAVEYVRMLVGSSACVRESAYFVASTHDRVIAAVELRRSPGSLFLNYIAVGREHQGKGVAAALLKAAIGMSGVLCSEMGLDVFEDNLRALDWYRRIGFQSRQTAEYLEIGYHPVAAEEEPAYASGLPQADLSQERFGFSQFSIATAGQTNSVGRIGHAWFRLIDPGACAAPAVFRVLRLLDPGRRFFTVAQRSTIPSAHIVQSLVRVHRMSAKISNVLQYL